MENGVCSCKPNFKGFKCDDCEYPHTGLDCDQCVAGFYKTGMYECQACGCAKSKSDGTCDQSGQCNCLPNFAGRKCNQCKQGHVGKKCNQCTSKYFMNDNGECESKSLQMLFVYFSYFCLTLNSWHLQPFWNKKTIEKWKMYLQKYA